MITGPPRAGSGRVAAVALALLVAGLLGALAFEVVWRHERWHAELQGVRFLDHLGALRDQLADYARADGPVGLELDPGCLPRLCQPDFSPDDLRC